MIKRIGYVVIACFLIGQVRAQTVEREPLSPWFTSLNAFRLTAKLKVSNELHYRFGETFTYGGRNTFLERPSLDYEWKKWLQFSIGYSLIHTSTGSPFEAISEVRIENNLWEQLLFTHNHFGAKFQHRLRQEHRWSQPNAVDSGVTNIPYNYGNRFRYRLTSFIPIKKLKGEQKIFAHVFDEIWIDQTDCYGFNHFSRNWFYAGLGWAANDDLNIQLGFMHQADWRKNNPDVVNSRPILQTTFVWNFNLQKEK